MSDPNEPLDLEAWEPQAPPPDFAQRVLEAVRANTNRAKASKIRRHAWIAGGAMASTLVVAATMAFVLRVREATIGDAIAKDRIEVSIGSRARAVLEPAAHVTWNGDDVEQLTGDVFYRVEPGKRFRVHTPAGDVEVGGTCFTVKVLDMQKRDIRVGSIGAALSAVAFVAVHEGKVAVSHAGQNVELAAGESAETGPGGITKGSIADGQHAFDTKALEANE